MSAIQQIFQEYVEQGGKPAVTHFRLHLNKLIDQEVKHLCGRSSKSGGDDWRSKLMLALVDAVRNGCSFHSKM